eukprot:comp21335_c0_seq2/m.29238 comp21335_c0_seq2/g.29238  ORF comp21335_c0_seq2/g.29238 comp21335_c0_seq2/m.29238 type:complete len:488 (-) comp21335_c0_seq2:82-1545(-)
MAGSSSEDDLGPTQPPAVSEATPLLAGIHESPEDRHARWRSIHFMLLTFFLSSIGFSILLSTVYSYLAEVDKGGYVGWVVASYSVGQMVGGALFGAWSNHRGVTEALVLTLVFNTVGNVMYCFSHVPDSGQHLFMCTARFLVGLGGGNAAVVRAYVSGATLFDERAKAMTLVAASQSLGFILGPVLGMLFCHLEPGLVWGAFRFDLYTGPAYLAAFLGVVNMLLIPFMFKAYRIDVAHNYTQDSSKSQSSESQNGAQEPTLEEGPRFDILGAVSVLVIYFVVMSTFAVFETMATPMARDEFAWTAKQADLYVGIAFGVAGFISLGVFMAVRVLIQKFGERPTLLGGFIVNTIGMAVTFPIGPPFSTPCENHEWCAYTPPMRVFQFYLGAFFNAIGYPTANVVSMVLYSKIIGPYPQGTTMGLITAVGSGARVIGPVVSALIYNNEGPRWLMGGVTLYLVVFTGFVLVVYRHLVPHVLYGAVTRVKDA